MIRAIIGTALLMGCMNADCSAQTDRVFLEVPLLLESPGQQDVVRAWYDGDRFYVDAGMLLEMLGFTLSQEGAKLTAVDANRRIVLDFALMRALVPTEISLKGSALLDGHRFMLSMEGLEHLFAADLHFDPDRLELRISTAAERFDATALHSRQIMWNEAPGPLRFGRRRTVLGGLMASWHLRRDPYYTNAGVQFIGSLFGGTVRGVIGSAGAAGTVLFDRPSARSLTRLELGQFSGGLRGIRLSNLPLARRQLHRIKQVSGQAEPHALVKALISGQLVDQVQADAAGLYELRTPVWYGTTRLELYMQPLGGAASTSQMRYLLTDYALVEPGRLYYDVRFGRNGLEEVGLAEFRYGLLPRLTLRSSADSRRRGQYQAGLTINPLSFVSVSLDASVPSRHWLKRLRMWRRSLSLDYAWDWRGPESNGMHAQLSGALGLLGITASAYSYVESGRWRTRALNPALWYHARSGLYMQAQWQKEQTNVEGTTLHKAREWRVAVGQSLARARVAVFTSGEHRWHTGGLEGFVALRNWSFGFNAAWEVVARRFVGGFTLQINTPLATLTARSRQSANGLFHAQSLQGSINVGSDLSLSRAMNQESAALLRIFEDSNGNGRKEKDEPLLPHVQAQLFHAAWERAPDGALYASYLEPYASYQVQILEASVHDPRLQPATGYTFSFVADPGRTKVIDVAMQRLSWLRGTIANADRAPSRMRVRIVGVQEAPVFRDGGFTMQAKPGTYTLLVEDVLTNEVLHTQSVYIAASPPSIVLDLSRP